MDGSFNGFAHSPLGSDGWWIELPCCGGDLRSRRMEERAADILAIWEKRRDITLDEVRLALADKGMDVSVAGLHRFFVRRGLTRKKRLS